MRILLFGAGGQVGTALRRSLAPLGDVVAATRTGTLQNDPAACVAADFDAPATLEQAVLDLCPDVVVNAAAYTAVDRAESEPDAAFRVNAHGPGVIARACVDSGARLVHYSTDYVFDGSSRRPYREDDPVSPLGVYGASKLAGEEAIQASGARHAIVRTAWVYAPHGHNFLKSMLRLASEREELRVVADQMGCPTPATFLADATARILANHGAASGTWHLAASGETSWHGFAEAIIDGAYRRGLLSWRPRLTPIETSAFPTLARRPVYSVLDSTQFQRDFAWDPLPWRQGLEQVLDDIAHPVIR